MSGLVTLNTYIKRGSGHGHGMRLRSRLTGTLLRKMDIMMCVPKGWKILRLDRPMFHRSAASYDV